jgi:branched-chain amino acid transport system ATP-binding protein
MALLEVTQLSRWFGGILATNNLSFSVNEGELLSIIGPNGAGKTTLFNLLTGIFKPSKGTIVFNGIDITGCKQHQAIRHGLGRTFQKTTVFQKINVLDNLIISQALHSGIGSLRYILGTHATRKEKQKMSEKAHEILSFVGLKNKEEKLAGNLTEEAQKRLSIAMVLATGPKFILLDEPTGGVNIDEIDGLIELVKKVRESGITICLIEHKMRMVMNISDRIIALNFGEKIAEGKPEEIACNDTVIKAYLGEKYVA